MVAMKRKVISKVLIKSNQSSKRDDATKEGRQGEGTKEGHKSAVCSGVRDPCRSLMEPQDGADLCFPQLLNISCRNPARSRTVLLNVLASSVSLLIVAFNLLVIISVSHFRQR